MVRFLRRFVCLLCAVSFSLAAAEKLPEFPEGFPEEYKTLKFREKDARELAPGVVYYHFHFDNIIPKNIKAAYRIVSFSFPGTTSDKDIKDIQKELQKEFKKEKKKPNLRQFAKKHGARTRALTVLEMPEGASYAKLKKVGDMTKPEENGKEVLFYMLSAKLTEFPVSIYYVIIDWNKAKVRLGLEQSGMQLKTVKEMVQPHDPVAAINGAYFTFVPPRTFYPLKINGKMYEPKPGYDSHTGLCFSGSNFPVLDDEKNFDQYDNVIMGYQVWKNGKYALDGKLEQWEGILSGDTPLTAVGLNRETKKLVLFTSDGRFPKDAPGLNFYSEAYFLSIIGCDEVLSIDGGGSCTMLIREKKTLSDPVNHPSDNGKFDHKGPRSVQNCIYLIEDK